MIRQTRPVQSFCRSLTWLFAVLLMLGQIGCSSTPATRAEQGGIYPRQAQATTPPDAHPAIKIALNQLNRPYRYGGISPRGFDCSGLVYYAYSRSGIDIPRTSLDQFRQSEPVSKAQIRPGDLLFFRIEKKSPSHVGMYVGEGRFIHASTSEKQVTLSQLESPYWRSRLIAAGRY